MENNDKFVRYVAIIALLIAVVGVSVGFAAFTNTLTIKAGAEVTPTNPNAMAVLSTSSSSAATGQITPTTSGASGVTGDVATLTATTIENIKAHFTEPGQTVTYSFNAYNPSAFVSYLNEVVFGTKTCGASSTDGATQYVTETCNNISMSVTIGPSGSSTTYTSSNTSISSHTIASNGSEPIVVTITYASNQTPPDGGIDVDFGDTTIKYGSQD